MPRRLLALLLCFAALLGGCGGGAATNTAPPAAIPPLTATTVIASASPVRTAAAGTATRGATVAAPASPSRPATAIASPQGTATRAATIATARTPVASTSPARAANVPLGVPPAGWRVYGGDARVPFALYYPPDWTVDESRANEGRVYFYAPGVSEPFEDAVWVLIATTGRVEPGGNIDVLRDQYYNESVRQGHPEAGIDVTRNNQFSGIVFASLGATFNVGDRLCYAYIGLGLNRGVPWRFRLNSPYADYSPNLDAAFAPMIGSLNIYANP